MQHHKPVQKRRSCCSQVDKAKRIKAGISKLCCVVVEHLLCFQLFYVTSDYLPIILGCTAVSSIELCLHLPINVNLKFQVGSARPLSERAGLSH